MVWTLFAFLGGRRDSTIYYARKVPGLCSIRLVEQCVVVNVEFEIAAANGVNCVTFATKEEIASCLEVSANCYFYALPARSHKIQGRYDQWLEIAALGRGQPPAGRLGLDGEEPQRRHHRSGFVVELDTTCLSVVKSIRVIEPLGLDQSNSNLHVA